MFVRQRGMALIVSLIILVVILILSLSSMQSSRMDEAMTGNYRASERALMAAEYGAAVVFGRIYDEDLDEYDISPVLADLANGVLGSIEEIEEGVYYRIEQDFSFEEDNEDITVNLVSVGIVGALSDSGVVDLVSQREIVFSFSLPGLDDLAAVNQVCSTGFSVPAVPSGVASDYELLEGGARRYKPAISTGSETEARAVLKGIFSTGTGNKSIDDLVEFVDNAYHAKPVITTDSDGNPYANYDRECKVQNNRMCAYVGGVSISHKAKILDRPDAFHEFIKAIFDNREESEEASVYVHDMSSGLSVFVDNAVNIYTDRRFSVTSDGEYNAQMHFSETNADGDLVASKLPASVWENGGWSSPIGENDAFLNFSNFPSSGEYQASLEGGSTYYPSVKPYLELDSWSEVDGGGYSVELPNVFGDYILRVKQGNQSNIVSRPSVYSDGGAYMGLSRPLFSTNELDGQRGVLVVDGNASFGGRPRFDGLIITLGSFSISGGGDEGSVFNGSVIVNPYFYNESDEVVCQPNSVNTSGGGNHKIIFNNNVLREMFQLLPPSAIAAWLVGNYGEDTVPVRLERWIERME